eukprot:TRINITY_DN318_c0_g2_i1.p1 TRINITY_DN318_c0_g2~~TRINITY_DN318_c0_g2_i1.p1  ORF type:complete len:219 (-),score=69.27 TRINITY_DN318_c0_g2_i1:7-663(-)
MSQVLLKYSNTITCLNDNVSSLNIIDIKNKIYNDHGIPVDEQRLIVNGKEIFNIVPTEESFLLINILLRLNGGKGGFGSNLKKGGSGKQKKTTNFTACRDLQGRRLRHVQAEQQIREFLTKKEDGTEEEKPVSDSEFIKRGLNYVKNVNKKQIREKEQNLYHQEIKEATSAVDNALSDILDIDSEEKSVLKKRKRSSKEDDSNSPPKKKKKKKNFIFF